MLLEKADEQEVDLEILGPVNCRNSVLHKAA